MNVFDDITIGFKGKEYTVKADKVWGLIRSIESVATLAELSQDPPLLAKTSEAYAVAINYAGGSVMPEEVYESLFIGNTSQAVQSTIESMIRMVLPPSAYTPAPATKKKDTGQE